MSGRNASMFDLVYDILNAVGFTHPLHPAITHLPMGMVMGAFIFSLLSSKIPTLAKTAYHCVVLALVFVIPTMTLGIMDWQHFYQGEWSGLIAAKFTLAGLFTLFLVAALLTGRRENAHPAALWVVYGLCLMTAIGLGFVGGQIQYG
jgi:uncharacterized membrane protein